MQKIPRLVRLAAVVACLAASFVFALPAVADPWKDESGTGRKHGGWKERDDDRGKGRQRDKDREKALGRAWKNAEKRAEKRERKWNEDRDERIERVRERERVVVRRAVLPARVAPSRAQPTAALPRATVVPTTTPRTRTAATRRTPTVRGAATPVVTGSTDARRRQAVASYMDRRPGG